MTDNKKMYRIALILFAAICFLGCQRESEKGYEAVGEEGQDEPYFDLEEIEENEPNEQVGFSFGVDNYEEEKGQIPYDGGVLQVDFEVDPQHCSFECAVLIYIDGILQEYALEPQGIPAEQHTVKVEDKKTILSVFFIPKIDEKKQKHRIHFLCMYDPGRQPENGSGSYGNSHKISQVMPWELVLTGTCEKTKEKIVPEKMDTISKEKRKEYEHGNENGKSDNELDEGIRFETERGQKEKEITFCILGGMAAKYRVSAYIGHKPVNFSNGAKYIDLSLDGKHMYEGSLFTEMRSDQDYDTLYFMAVPISHLGTAMVEKSSSMCLYQGGLQDAANK